MNPQCRVLVEESADFCVRAVAADTKPQGNFSAMSSVRSWIRDIRWSFESEHVTLQAKSIPKFAQRQKYPVKPSRNVRFTADMDHTFTLHAATANHRISDVFLLVDSNVLQIQKLLQQASQVTQSLNHGNQIVALRQLCEEVSSAVLCLRHDLERFHGQRSLNDLFNSSFEDLFELNEYMFRKVDALACHVFSKNVFDRSLVQASISSIAEVLQEFFAVLFFYECAYLVDRLGNPIDTRARQDAILEMGSLAQRGHTCCALLCEAGAVQALYKTIQMTANQDLQVCALRALTGIMVHPEACAPLREEKRLEHLVALLWKAPSEAVRCEVTGFLAQIAAHFPRDYAKKILDHCQNEQLLRLVSLTPPIVRYITKMCEDTRSEDVLLVSAACFARMSMLPTTLPTVDIMLQQETVFVLLEAWRKGIASSIVTKNQMIIILFNVSSDDLGMSHLLRSSALPVFLVDAIQQYNTSHSKETSVAKYGYSLKRCLNVIARLCADHSFAKAFHSLKGDDWIRIVLASSHIDKTATNLCLDILSLIRSGSSGLVAKNGQTPFM